MILRNYVFIYAIENNLPIPIGQQEADLLDDLIDTDKTIDPQHEFEFKFLSMTEIDYKTTAEKIYKSFNVNDFKWLNSKLFIKELKDNLLFDCKSVLEILEIGKNWKAEFDKQLNALDKLIN